MLYNELPIILALLFIKHFLVDFVFQTNEHVKHKGTYGNLKGIEHSIQHAVGTALMLIPFVGFEIAALIGLIDGVIHYHIDWAKMSINRIWHYTVEQSQFWMWLGADQLLHSLTYVWIVWLLF